MKALVFAAGLGTRLRPLTDTKPKALVEVDGVAMLERVILKLKSAGIDSVIVNVHHFADKIIDFLKEKDNFGLEIVVSDERDMLLETGGGILKARPLLDGDEPFVVHNADILTDFDLRKMIDFHVAEGNDVTLLVDDRNSSRRLLFDGSMGMRGWKNMTTGETIPQGIDDASLMPLAFGGVHVINPQPFFSRLVEYATEPKFSITPFYSQNCGALKIGGYRPLEKYGWFDIGSIEQLNRASLYLREK